MRFDTISLFPTSLDEYFSSSIIGRACKTKKISILHHDLRAYSRDKHKKVDDTPYGGGPGMVIRVDVVHRALKAIYKKKSRTTRVLLLSPRGRRFDQRDAKRLARYKRVILIAGRYEAIDARIEPYVDEVVSIGDFVLTGGELAAACIIDAVSRLVPGVVGAKASLAEESFSGFSGGRTTIEYPHYTRPETYRGKRVPAVLLSGDHRRIQSWRQAKSSQRSSV